MTAGALTRPSSIHVGEENEMTTFFLIYLLIGAVLITSAYFLRKKPDWESRIVWPIILPELGLLLVIIWPIRIDSPDNQNLERVIHTRMN